MIPLTALPNIAPQKTLQSREVLDDLLTKEGIITGYNWYLAVPQETRLVTFSHMHETEAYKQAMMKEIAEQGYTQEQLQRGIRRKFGSYQWRHHFVFRDEAGTIFPDLNIRTKTGNYLDLSRFPARTLEGIAELAQEGLVGENEGWELNLAITNKEKLLAIMELFLRKSSRERTDHWPDAYEIPVLLLGKEALTYARELPDFIVAKKMELIENGNEISFITHAQFPVLKETQAFAELEKIGFKEESCLANRAFIETYVDKR